MNDLEVHSRSPEMRQQYYAMTVHVFSKPHHFISVVSSYSISILRRFRLITILHWASLPVTLRSPSCIQPHSRTQPFSHWCAKYGNLAFNDRFTNYHATTLRCGTQKRALDR